MQRVEKTCRLATLGCKVNQYESQFVKEAFEVNGFREATDGEPADVCVVNTCTVTMEGDAKSRQLIRRLHQAQPGARIVVMGCYATRDPDALARLPGVSRVITDKNRLQEELLDEGVTLWPAGISRFDGHQRAFVKVQDGCLLNCSYCIIPSVRPVLRSRSIDDIAAEVKTLVESGVQEVVLTGVHLGHYGFDLSKGKPKNDWLRLWTLLRKLDALPGRFRIRLSSLEAAEARDDLVSALAECRRVVPHLHLCLQSGSDRILHAMRRRYSSAGFLRRVERIRSALENPAITTDVIVGFPGETDADFAETCRVAREAGLSKIHVFSYSPREGTSAASLGYSVPPAIIRERRETLNALGQELATRYHRSLVGTLTEVIAEGPDERRPGNVLGTSCRYAPVSFRGFAPAVVGKLSPVRLAGIADGVMLGEPEFETDAHLLSESHPGAREVRRRSLALVSSAV